MSFELWYTDDQGNRIALLQPERFSYVLTQGDVGAVQITLPSQSGIPSSVAPDRRIEIWRIPRNGQLSLEMVALARKWTFRTTPNGAEWLDLGGVDMNDLLNRRIVAFAAETSQAQKDTFADDMMKEFIDENLVNPATAARTVDILTIEPDTSDADRIVKDVSWQNLLRVIQGIQATSKALGNEVFWGIRPNGATSFVFGTKTGQWGNDRSMDSGNPLIFSPERGNLTNVTFSDDYTREQNYIYAGGQGLASERETQEASDSDRINVSAYNRREGFASATTADSSGGVLSAANDSVSRGRPKKIIRGEILDTDYTPYGGYGWHMGDRVTIDYANMQFDALIRSVSVQVRRGRERIRARIEAQI